MSWQQSTLSDLIELENGYAFKSDEYTDDGHFLMRIANVQQGYISMQAPKFVLIPPHSNLIQFQLNEGDMLMSLTGNVGRVGLIEAHHLPAALNQRVARIKIKDLSKIDKGYLFSFLNTDDTRKKIENLANGAAQLNVSTKDVKSLTIPLPSLAQQQRIAAVLDKAAEIKAKREKAMAKLDELTQSTFVETFGHEKWSKVAIAEVTEQVQSCSPQNRFVGEFTYVDIGAVDNVSKTVISPQLIDKNDAPSRARQLIKKDDVLVSTVRPNLNAVAKVESEYLNAVASTGFCVLRCKQDMVLPEYIFAIVKSTKFVNEMVRLATGASYPAVSDKIISQYLIPLPPIALQRAFAEKIKALREYASKSVRHEGKLIGLTASLQHQAFTTGFNA